MIIIIIIIILNYEAKESNIKDNITITWDMSIITDKKVKYNKPDSLIYDSIDNICKIIDILIPNCLSIFSKGTEKITKYNELEIELKKCSKL